MNILAIGAHPDDIENGEINLSLGESLPTDSICDIVSTEMGEYLNNIYGEDNVVVLS